MRSSNRARWAWQPDQRRYRCFVVLVCLLSLGIGLQAQEDVVPPPGKIQLLSGYHHERLEGVDSIVGRIWKLNGPTIYYDLGYGTTVNDVKQQGGYLWYKEQVINGKPVQLLLTRDRALYITFLHDRAAFYSQVNTEEELVEVLLMLTTYPGCEPTS